MIDRYAAKSGLDLSDLPVYLAFSAWRGACISAGVLARYESGAMGDDGFDFRGMREGFGTRAESALEAAGQHQGVVLGRTSGVPWSQLLGGEKRDPSG